MLLRCTVPEQKIKGTCFLDTSGLLDDYLGIIGWLFGIYSWIFEYIRVLGYTPVGLSDAQVYSP